MHNALNQRLAPTKSSRHCHLRRDQPISHALAAPAHRSRASTLLQGIYEVQAGRFEGWSEAKLTLVITDTSEVNNSTRRSILIVPSCGRYPDAIG